MQILETLIGVVLALLLTFIVMGAVKDALTRDDFIVQGRALALLIESLEQDDSKTMLIDFSKKNAIFFLSAGADTIEYARSGIGSLSFYPSDTTDQLAQFQNYVRAEIKFSGNSWSTVRFQFKDQCLSGTCLCLCTEWKSDEAKRQDSCSAKYSCFPLEKGMLVSPVAGAPLIEGSD